MDAELLSAPQPMQTELTFACRRHVLGDAVGQPQREVVAQSKGETEEGGRVVASDLALTQHSVSQQLGLVVHVRGQQHGTPLGFAVQQLPHSATQGQNHW